MTQQVCKSYRDHRKATLALVLGVVAAIATVLVPLATGAAPKYYILTTSPSAICFTGAGQRQQFTLKVTNDSRNNTLGSAEITAPNFIALVPNTLGGDVTTGSSNDERVIKLRNLGLLTQGDDVEVTVWAEINGADVGNWTSVAKQSNSFADAPGPGNLFTLRPSPPSQTSLTASTCSYVFTNGTPNDALRGAAQTVTVELQANGVAVSGSGTLNLVAYQGTNNTTTPLTPGIFEGLATTASSGSWTFSAVTGTVSGGDYRLRIQGTNTYSSYFMIADCIPDQNNSCNIAFTPSDAGVTGGGSATGSQIGSPIALSFSSVPTQGRQICTGWGWSPLTFPEQPDGSTTFDGITLTDYTYADEKGYLKLKTYLRNDLYVQTNPSNTNDILICAGGKHSGTWANETVQGGTTNAFMGRGGILAKWDTETGLYWGVLERVPNCNKSVYLNSDPVPDPVLCAWGTEDVTYNGVTTKYRTATVLVPADWDWKNFG